MVAFSAIIPFLPAPFRRSPSGGQQVGSFFTLWEIELGCHQHLLEKVWGYFPLRSPPPLSVSLKFEVLIQPSYFEARDA